MQEGNVIQKPYAGNGKPFIYAQFAPDDRESAEEILAIMRERGYEIWLSERFDRRRMEKSALALFFLSPAAAANERVNLGVSRAAQANHPMLAVHLAPTELTAAQKLLLNTQQAILRYEFDTEGAFFEKLFGSRMLQNLRVTRAQKRAARLTGLAVGGGVLLAAALAAILLLRPDAVVPEDSLMAQLGFSGRMSDITNIYIYGKDIAQERNDRVIISVIYDSVKDSTSKSVFYNDLSSEAAYGDIENIADFQQLKNLKELSIAGNQVENISALYRLRKLEYLDLSGNPVSDIDGIGRLKRLKTLCIGGTQITDISALDACKNLEQVFVDPEQYHMFSAEASQYRFAITSIGPQEELKKLYCHIFGGPDDNCAYGLYARTVSGNVYEDYTYEFYKNDRQIQITGRAYDDEIMDKTHLLIDEAAMGRYDKTAKYTLVVKYGSSSATYQMWHAMHLNVKNCRVGELIESAG